MVEYKVQRQARAVDREEEQGTNNEINVDIENLALRKVLKGKRGKTDGVQEHRHTAPENEADQL